MPLPIRSTIHAVVSLILPTVMLASTINPTVANANESSGIVDGYAISFDLPSTAVATPVTPIDARASVAYGAAETVEVNLRLSSLVCGSELPRIDRWIVRCVPRSSTWQVVDYAPRTETATEFAGPIQVKQTDEETTAFGLSTDAAPINFHGAFAGAKGHVGFDQAEKQGTATQYEKHAPLHAVTASGTIERGRGVYYKLSWTSTQILEGEKEFKIQFAVPEGMRAGLMDVSVVAVGKPNSRNAVAGAFAQMPMLGDDGQMQALGEGRFVVAVHAEGDPVAWKAAQAMADVEASLREQAKGIRAKSPAKSLSSLIRHVAARFDVDSVDVHGDWIDRVVFGNADPHTDPVIRKLPTELRVAALDYCDARRKIQTLQTRRTPSTVNRLELERLVGVGTQTK